MTCCSQGKGLTATSACDLGDTCHLGLFLLHEVKAQGMALHQQAHACTKFHHCFQHSQRQLNLSAYFTPRQAIKSGGGKHLPTLQAVWFLITSCHHQQNRPSCPTLVVDETSPSTGTQWRCNGSGPRYFVCASLGFSNPDILETRIFPERT